MKFPALACLAALFVSAATAPAFAEENSILRIDLSPGDSRTIYVNGQEGSPALPVFRICYVSPAGYSGALRTTKVGKSPVYGSDEPMAPNQCLFASGEKLVVSVDADLPPEEGARHRATAWLTERVEALRALPDPTEVDKAVLEEFEDRLSETEASTVITDVDAYLESQTIVVELESKESLTDKEKAQLVFSKAKLAALTGAGGTFRVTLLAQ
jgi:hypothetical protein